MISKEEFIERIKELDEISEADWELDRALKRIAPSDFTGFSRPQLTNEKLNSLVDDMDDKYEYISWWLYDCPDHGKGEDSKCTVWSTDEKTKWVIKTPEDLYDFLVELYQKEEEDAEEEVREFVSEGLARRAQIDGVRFAINVITQLRHTNKKTNGAKASEIEALLKYVSDKIETEYALSTGIFTKLYENESITLFSNDTK